MFTGTQIRSKRKSDGLSVEQLAILLDVKKDSLYKWEKGTRPNNIDDYLKIENWLNGKLESFPSGETAEKQENTLEADAAQQDSGKKNDNVTIQSLARSIELDAEARLVNAESRRIEARNIERLVALLEKKSSSDSPSTTPVAPERKGIAVAGQEAEEDLALDKKYRTDI